MFVIKFKFWVLTNPNIKHKRNGKFDLQDKQARYSSRSYTLIYFDIFYFISFYFAKLSLNSTQIQSEVSSILGQIHPATQPPNHPCRIVVKGDLSVNFKSANLNSTSIQKRRGPLHFWGCLHLLLRPFIVDLFKTLSDYFLNQFKG